MSAISEDALMEFFKAGFLVISRKELSKACAKEGLTRTYPLLCAYSTTTLALSRGLLRKNRKIIGNRILRTKKRITSRGRWFMGGGSARIPFLINNGKYIRSNYIVAEAQLHWGT
jgi:hypothetical protein